MIKRKKTLLAALVVDHLVAHAAIRQHKSVRAIEPAARELLARIVWRVDEDALRDVIERVVAAMGAGAVVTSAQVAQLLVERQGDAHAIIGTRASPRL